MAHKGWYAAVDLRAGDILVLVNGEYVTLEKTQHEILEAPIDKATNTCMLNPQGDVMLC